jgi:hypothetical protein
MSGGLLSKGLLGNEVRSELVRIRRRSVLLGWLGLTAVLGVLVNTVMFSVVADAEGAATSGPGVSFPSLAVLESPEGLTAGVASASSLLGMVTLALWALLTATDYSTGMVRLLVAAQPERWRLLAGKVVALALWTSVVALLALVVNVVAAPAGASAAGIDTDAWAQVRAADLLSAWASLYSALLAWGVLGLTLATLTRSAAVAISIGAGLRAAPRRHPRVGAGRGRRRPARLRADGPGARRQRRARAAPGGRPGPGLRPDRPGRRTGRRPTAGCDGLGGGPESAVSLARQS